MMNAQGLRTEVPKQPCQWTWGHICGCAPTPNPQMLRGKAERRKPHPEVTGGDRHPHLQSQRRHNDYEISMLYKVKTKQGERRCPNSNCDKPRARAQGGQNTPIDKIIAPPKIKRRRENTVDATRTMRQVWCGKIGWLRLGAAVGRREGSGVRERGAHVLSLRLGGLETLRRRRQNTAGKMENKPTQGKTGLSHRRPRDDRRRCGAARPGATKPRVLTFGRG